MEEPSLSSCNRLDTYLGKGGQRNLNDIVIKMIITVYGGYVEFIPILFIFFHPYSVRIPHACCSLQALVCLLYVSIVVA